MPVLSPSKGACRRGIQLDFWSLSVNQCDQNGPSLLFVVTGSQNLAGTIPAVLDSINEYDSYE